MTRVLCLVPTRELGVQVYTVTKNLASFSTDIQVFEYSAIPYFQTSKSE